MSKRNEMSEGSVCQSKKGNREKGEKEQNMKTERFHCPYPGCTRSFADLWRLKVHYRAAPGIRGSGKERGHGSELNACPKCHTELRPGKHHVKCNITNNFKKHGIRKKYKHKLKTIPLFHTHVCT